MSRLSRSRPTLEASIAVTRRITEVTRRRLIEGLAATAWYGALDEVQFLGRLYDLDGMPSKDSRYRTARQDIGVHCIANYDRPDDWIFDDDRFDLATSDDAILAFLLVGSVSIWGWQRGQRADSV